jgi:hypothetical protein
VEKDLRERFCGAAHREGLELWSVFMRGHVGQGPHRFSNAASSSSSSSSSALLSPLLHLLLLLLLSVLLLGSGGGKRTAKGSRSAHKVGEQARCVNHSLCMAHPHRGQVAHEPAALFCHCIVVVAITRGLEASSEEAGRTGEDAKVNQHLGLRCVRRQRKTCDCPQGRHLKATRSHAAVCGGGAGGCRCGWTCCCCCFCLSDSGVGSGRNKQLSNRLSKTGCESHVKRLVWPTTTTTIGSSSFCFLAQFSVPTIVILVFVHVTSATATASTAASTG